MIRLYLGWGWGWVYVGWGGICQNVNQFNLPNEMADKHNVSVQQSPWKQMIFQHEILPQLRKCLYTECKTVCSKK